MTSEERDLIEKACNDAADLILELQQELSNIQSEYNELIGDLDFAYKRTKTIADILGIKICESPNVTGTILGIVRREVEKLQAENQRLKNREADFDQAMIEIQILTDKLRTAEQRTATEIREMVKEYHPGTVVSVSDEVRECMVLDICLEIEQKYHIED